jgi:peptidyl-prolyl cis-trans isomerase D
MLATIHEKVKGIVAAIVLFLVGVPFILWGINSYFESGPSLSVAKVDGEPIAQRDYRAALEQFRGRIDPKTAESVPFKQMVLDGLIEQQLLLRDAEAQGFRIGDAALAGYVRQLPYFQRNGRFEPQLYDALLRREGIGVQEFERRLRGEVVTGQVQGGLAGSGFVTEADALALARLLRQERDITHALVRTEPLAARAAVTPAEIEQHYTASGDRYRSPEQVRVEYVRLSTDDLARKITPTEDELRKAHAEEVAKVAFEKRKPELLKQVRARKAEERLFELTERFQTLAYEHPDSLGPAADALGATVQRSGWFTRAGGDGVASSPRVIEAAFSQEVLVQGRNSDPVETKPGEFVAVRRLEHRPAARRPLAEVRAQIERELKQQKAEAEAQRIAQEMLQALRGGASLGTLASKYGAPLQSAKAITREKPGGLDPRVLEAAFRAPRPAGAKPVFGTAMLGSQGVAVFALTRAAAVEPGQADAALKEKARRMLLAHRGGDYYAMYRAGLRQKGEIKVFADRL